MSHSFTPTDPLTLAVLGTVHADSLVPFEQPSAPKILNSADCYLQRFVKYPHKGVFHSYSEFLHALLLEADADVQAFIPQPYKLRVNGRIYIPDCYVLRCGQAHVIELKPGARMNERLYRPVKAYLAFHNIAFSVLANDCWLIDNII